MVHAIWDEGSRVGPLVGHGGWRLSAIEVDQSLAAEKTAYWGFPVEQGLVDELVVAQDLYQERKPRRHPQCERARDRAYVHTWSQRVMPINCDRLLWNPGLIN